MRNQRIKTFYTPNQVLREGYAANYSKSPKKPELLLKYFEEKGLLNNFKVISDFEPFTNEDFEIAHHNSYVKEFFTGGPRSASNGLTWSKEFAETVRYTNASIYNAIRNAVTNPSEVSFSPTSGFHHARPSGGSGFCTFSGQVIASIKIWREFGLSGAYLDLDGHFGNSIEDSRDFAKGVNAAIPRGFNFNPVGTNDTYVEHLEKFLGELETAILNDKIHYVVWCHGADSHQDDQLGHQCSTEHWVKCATIFWSWVKKMDTQLGKPLPVACALFGGYRDDDYNSVLSLHTADFVECLTNLLDKEIKYTIEVVARKRYHYDYHEYSWENRKRMAKKTQRRLQERRQL